MKEPFLKRLSNLFFPKDTEEQRSIGFEAAVETRKDSPIAFFDVQRASIRGQRNRLRYRARDIERNSTTTGAILAALKNNVIGTGFNLQVRSSDEEYNQRIETLWKEWCHHENCDWVQKQSLTDMLKLILTRYYVDGGILLTFPLDKSRKIPLTVQLHDVEEFEDTDYFKPTGNTILEQGVELTKDGRAVAYWLKRENPDGLMSEAPIKIPAENAIFLWDKTAVCQYRELTMLARGIVPTKDLEDYNNAVAFQQKVAGSLSAFIEKEGGTMGAPGRVANRQDGSRVERIEGGMVKYLNEGERLKTIVPAGQAAEVGECNSIQQRKIAADLGLSLESTARNVERVNYSSARQNLLNDNVTYEAARMTLIEYVLRPLLKRFIEMCYLTGRLDDTTFELGNEEFYQAEWLSKSIGWIDPKKEAEANTINLANGGKSFQQYCAEQGVDWRERIDSMAEVQEYAKKKGVDLCFSIRKGADNENQTDSDERY